MRLKIHALALAVVAGAQITVNSQSGSSLTTNSDSEGRWMIANLSETNPLRLNGLELASDSAAVPLSDGDVIELGEVMLRFHG